MDTYVPKAIDSQVGGVIIGFSPPPVPRGLMNTQDSESSMALTAPENSLLELTVTKASKSSKIVESSDLSRTPPKSRKSRDADNPVSFGRHSIKPGIDLGNRRIIT